MKIGEYSRGGLTRGDNQASDHDMGCKEKYVPCGIVDEDNAELTITFGAVAQKSPCEEIRVIMGQELSLKLS